ncbi:NAD(P)-binding protein [bacterium]|nr:NAD(P)-binding protein [bacterium]
MKNLIVGAGLTGAVIAERIASKLNEEVTVIERASHIGGMHYDYVDKESGILVQPKHVNFLHTNNKFIWDYLSKFAKLQPLTFRPLVQIQGINATMPLCLMTLHEVFPEDFAKMLENKLIAKFGYNKKITLAEMHRNFDDDLKFLAEYFYENVFKPYTIKQWGISENSLPDCADTYYPFDISLDDRYFKEKYQAIPSCGWAAMIENILKHKNIKLKLNTDFSEINANKYDRIFYTGSIDEYFDYKHGELPYRSVRVEIDDKLTEINGQTFNYPYSYDFIRANVFKNIMPNKSYNSSKDFVGFEYIEDFELGKNERFYPINNAQSQAIFTQYTELAKEIPNLFFAGRLGEFKYYESDELVTRAFETVARLMINDAPTEQDFETEDIQIEAESVD